ncbi:hypothetical protein [Planobispora rosea]|uniref:hypothetical protein n=1 Tax=Planobispora rosea TaxID=35762 RepID=UPI00114C9FDA|nr:hypothetical protein [Planobispora rosea]
MRLPFLSRRRKRRSPTPPQTVRDAPATAPAPGSEPEPEPEASREPSPEASTESKWNSRLQTLGTLGPPTTIITVVLIWCGYVATWQRFRYFGVYLELADLPNQDLIFYGVETVYPIAAILLLAVFAVLLLHLGVRTLLASPLRRTTSALVWVLTLTGAAVMVRGLVGLFVPEVPRAEVPGTTPLSLALGAPLLAYVLWLRREFAARGGGAASASASASAETPAVSPPPTVELGIRLAAAGVGVVGLFWSANTFAAEAGLARGYEDALELSRRPEVVLYAKEPLPDVPPITDYTDLGEEVTHRHRYRGFRLLLESRDRLFLVPLTWRPGDRSATVSTFVISYGSNVRLQLLPQ